MAITTGALLGAAGIGAAGSLLGGLFSSGSQKSANETNLEIAKETNRHNEELFNRQLAWQEDMWNKTNAYNDPKHLVELYQKAGVNPAQVFGSADTASASVPSVPSAPQMQSASVSPINYEWLGNVVDHGVNAYLNNQILNNTIQKTGADAQIAKTQAEFDSLSLQDRLMRIANDSKKSQYERDMARDSMEILNGTKRYQILQSEKALQMTDKQMAELDMKIESTRLANEISQNTLKWSDKLNAAQYQSLQAGIRSALSAAALNNQQAVESAARKTVEDLRASGLRIDNDTAKRVQRAVVNTAYANAQKASDESAIKSYEKRNWKSGERLRRLTSAIPLTKGF